MSITDRWREGEGCWDGGALVSGGWSDVGAEEWITAATGVSRRRHQKFNFYSYLIYQLSICHLSSIYHIFIIYLSSNYLTILYLSSVYHLSIIYISTYLSSIYHLFIYHKSIYHLYIYLSFHWHYLASLCRLSIIYLSSVYHISIINL